MEPIRRPDNVHVPRALAKRIEARRALQGSAEDMRATLRSFGEKAPNSEGREKLEARLYAIIREGNTLSIDEDSPAASSTAKGGE